MKKFRTSEYSIFKNHQCRVCHSKKLYRFLSFGTMPLPNGFVSKSEGDKKYYPLALSVCESCWLVQLTHTIPAEIMFRNYLYIPSTSEIMQKHFKDLAMTECGRFDIKKDDLIVDIGSNDGTLLSYFKNFSKNILGVDPATNLAKAANKKQIRTINDFFTKELTSKIIKASGQAKIITATNVIAHIADLHQMAESVQLLLSEKGVFMIEVPYLIDLLDRNEFDTVYHEHLSYFSIGPLDRLFSKHDLEIIDVRKFPVHGGTVRIYVGHKQSFKIHPRVKKIRIEEKLKKLQSRSTYDEFAIRTKQIRRDLVQLLKRIHKHGQRVVGYGASAKGNVLLNYCELSTEQIEYIVDSIPYKQGKYTPGTHIPIFSEAKLERDNPDYALLLSWNFADEIIQKNKSFRERGGQFIIPVPYLKIV